MTDNLNAEEHARRQSNRDAVAEFFKEHQGQWIAASALADIGGTLAWRTRISEARRQLGMHIENRQEKDYVGGVLNVRSYYRYLTFAPIGPSADRPREANLFTVSDRLERR